MANCQRTLARKKGNPALPAPLEAVEVVATLGAGFFPQKLLDCLSEVCEEVKKHAPGTAGSVAVKFDITYIGDEIGCAIKDSYKVTFPSREGLGSFYFSKNGLHKSDPRRPEFVYRTVDQDTGEIRDGDQVALPVRESDNHQ